MVQPFSDVFEQEIGKLAKSSPGNIGLLLSAGHDSPCIAIALHNNNIPFIAYTHTSTIIKEDVNTLEAITKYVHTHRFIDFDTPGHLLTKVTDKDNLGTLFAGLGGDEMCSGNWLGIDEYIYLYKRACAWNKVEPQLPYCSPVINESYGENGYGGRKPLQNYLARHGVPLPTKKVAFDEYLDSRGKEYAEKKETESIADIQRRAEEREQVVNQGR